MPDISKLEQLCRVLDLSVGELLGLESRETRAVEKILKEEDACLTVEELSDIAPLLPPEQVKEQTRKKAEEKTFLRAAAAKGVKVYGLSDSLVAGTPEKATLLLGFGGLKSAEIIEGTDLLKSAWL